MVSESYTLRANENEEKRKMILRFIGMKEGDYDIVDYFLFANVNGNEPGKPRPIKNTVSTVFKNSPELKDVSLARKIYVKADKSKGEMEEYKGLGKQKDDLFKVIPY